MVGQILGASFVLCANMAVLLPCLQQPFLLPPLRHSILQQNARFAWHKARHYAMSKNADSSMQASPGTLKEKERKDYACQRQFNERPSFIPVCPRWLQRT